MYNATTNSLLIHKSTPHTLLPVFSVLAAKVTLHRTITVASIYIFLSITLPRQIFPRFTNNCRLRYYYWETSILQPPPLWSSSIIKPHGRHLESLFDDNCLVIFNTQCPLFIMIELVQYRQHYIRVVLIVTDVCTIEILQ